MNVDALKIITDPVEKVGAGLVREQVMKSLRKMYPDGVDTPQQHRDIILIYLIGWGDSLKAAGLNAELARFSEIIAPMCDPNWWPGSLWCWWG